MKTRIYLSLLLVGIVQLSIAQNNEKRFGIELNSGASIAVNKLGDATLDPGFGFEGVLHYRFLQHTGIYAGWGWNRMGAKESFAGNDVCFEETGYVFGLNFNHPITNNSISYYLRAGGLYNHIEIENEAGEITHDTGHGFGVQLAGGLDFDLGSGWSFTPGIKCNLLTREATSETYDQELKYNYLMLRAGILKRF